MEGQRKFTLMLKSVYLNKRKSGDEKIMKRGLIIGLTTFYY